MANYINQLQSNLKREPNQQNLTSIFKQNTLLSKQINTYFNKPFPNNLSKIKMRNQFDITDYLSEYVKCMHNQQHAVVQQNLTHLLNLNKEQSLTLNLLTQEVNLSLQDLPQKVNNKPQYFEQDQFILSPLLRKIGSISKQLTQLVKFGSQQEEFLAEFQTLKFLQLFPAQNKSKYAQQRLYQHSIIDFIKPIYPRMNVHRDNLPLYMPFYHSIDSYCTETAIGNPNWELSRKTFNRTYRQQMAILNDQTRDGNTLQQQQDVNNNKDAWFELLMCDSKYIKRYQQKGGIGYLWVLMHFYYVQQSLKPYRNVRSNDFNNRSQTVTLDMILQTLKTNIQGANDVDSKFLNMFILYQFTQEIDDLVNLLGLVKYLSDDNIEALNKNTITRQDSRLNYIALVNTVCSQLMRNLIQGQSIKEMRDQIKEMRDQTRINTLTQYLTQTITDINNYVANRLYYHDFYLRVAYPSHLDDKEEIRKNQQQIFHILQQQLNKDLQQTTDFYAFPQYGYFERNFYQEFSKIYLKKHPNTVIQIAQFLPADVVVWRLLNSPNLSDHNEFFKIKYVLLKNKQRFIQAIQQRIPQVTESNYVNFFQSWDMFHQLLQNQRNQQNQQQISQFMKKLRDSKVAIEFIYGQEFPQVFRQHVYFVLDKGENILRLTDHMIQGFQSILTQVDYQQQRQIVSQYSQFLNKPKFHTHLLSKLTQDQKDQFWKKWTAVYLADQSLVKELIGGDQSQMLEDQQSQQIQEDSQQIQEEDSQQVPSKVINGQIKKPQKQTNEVIFMELDD